MTKKAQDQKPQDQNQAVEGGGGDGGGGQKPIGERSFEDSVERSTEEGDCAIHRSLKN